MKKLLLASLLSLATLVPTTKIQAENMQIWTELKLSYGLTDRQTISWGMENRFFSIDETPQHGLFNNTLAWQYKLVDWGSGNFALGAAARYEKEDGNDGEFRPMAQFFLTQKWGPTKFALRNRLEFRIRGDQRRFRWRVRGKINWVKFKVADKLSISPFLSNELFWQEPITDGSGGRGIDQNRFVPLGLGFGFKLGSGPLKEFKSSLYYMLRTDKGSSGSWSPKHVLGTGFGFKF